jgi:hypothetical protein
VNATTINAAPFNANFSALQTCGNSIDNTNIGMAGIYASQIIPTTVGQATFGGSASYTFSTALTLAAATVLTYNANSAGALFTALGSNNGIATNASGGGGEIDLYAGYTTTQIAGFWLNTGATAVEEALVTQAGTYTVGSSTFGATAAVVNGPLEAKSSSALSYVPPVYTAAGAAVASTAHMVTGTTSIGTVSSGSFVTVAVTLSGAAVFSSSSSYVVTATLQSMGIGTFAGNTILATPTSGSSFQITVYAPTGSGITGVSVQWTATGT